MQQFLSVFIIALTACSLLFTGTARAQTEIAGVVTDGETGEVLPSATILLEGSYHGTITNAEGHFSLVVDELPVVLAVRYIGYETGTAEVTEATAFPVFISLFPSVTELEEIVVTDRDPGLSIMERVIERKKLWRAGLESWQVDAHTRQVLENDTAIVSITESHSRAFWDHERGPREVQLSTRQTSNIAEGQNFAGVSYLPNFYDDDITIAGYRVVGITHPDALRFYHFKLLETLQMDGAPVYKIGVSPRRTRQPTFEGVAYVLGREYALLEVDLKPNDVVSFPAPVQDFDLSYKQQFSNYGGDFWLPVDMRTEGVIRIGMIGLQFPSIRFRQASRLSGYEVNIALPDSVYESNEWLLKPDSTDAGLTFREIDPIPLTLEEREAYDTIDSTQTLEEVFRPEGFLVRTFGREGGGDRQFHSQRGGTCCPVQQSGRVSPGAAVQKEFQLSGFTGEGVWRV